MDYARIDCGTSYGLFIAAWFSVGVTEANTSAIYSYKRRDQCRVGVFQGKGTLG